VKLSAPLDWYVFDQNSKGGIKMATTNTQLEQLKTLYDYTKFHIGLYGTLLAGFVGVSGFAAGHFSRTSLFGLKLATFLLLIAAMSGGVVASSIVDVYRNYGVWKQDVGLEKFWSTPLGPFKQGWMTAKTWWCIEHTAFWVAVLIVVGGFLLKGIVWGFE
jgi:hypothetical protein